MNVPADYKIAVFTKALELPDRERAAYVERACDGDEELLRGVKALLQEFVQVGDFLENPPNALWNKAKAETDGAEKPGDWIGHYKLLQQIGEGGCGVVFMAEQSQPVHRTVALKIIKPGMDTKSVIARFQAERQALAMMDHPNIARIFDAGATQSGRPYFVMELVRGIKITEYCDEHLLTTEERLKLFVQVCEAVQHAHQKGIIHRDIKPSNILVTATSAGTALPVVIDFGIAKATSNQRLTDTTLFTAYDALIGTPAYMSPEQAAFASVDVDTRTDIYSLGVLLYELLTGSPPFDTERLLKSGLDEIRRVIREQDPAPPSTRLDRMRGESLTVVARQRGSEALRLIRSIRGDLDWIAMKAMEKDRARRYETANGLAEDIKRFLSHETVLARPPTAIYRVQKTIRRNRLLFAGLGIVGTLLLVSLIVVSASLSREKQSEREAEQVKQFLEQMLQGVGPNVALGRDTAILREILDQAAARVGKELTNQPAVEAELRGVIGTLYYRMGRLPQAEEMQRAALAIRQKRFGAESPEAATSLDELGSTLLANGKLSEAEQATRKSLDIRRRRFGNENANVAASQNDLAHVYSENGKLTEAEALARESLATRQRLFGNESLEAADSLRTLSIILGDNRRWPESEAMTRDVLEMRRTLLGSEHPWIASALNDVAWAAAANGKQEEAETLEREALAMRQKLLSPEHPDVAHSLYLVGDRMRQRGNLDEAYPILSAALSIQRKVLGEDHPSTLYTLKSLGLMYKTEHRWAEAETVFREVLAAWRKRPESDRDQMYTLRDLADAYEGQNRWADAEALHREALAYWRKQEGDSGAETLYTLHKVGIALSSQGKWPQAETVYREEWQLRYKQAGHDAPDTLYALRNLGITLEFESKWTEAERVHRDELASWRSRVGNEDPQTLYTLNKLGWALEGQDKWFEAESAYRDVLTSRHHQLGKDASQILPDTENLIRILAREKKFGEAEQLLTETLMPAVAAQSSSCNLLIQKLDLMGRQGRWEEAAAVASLIIDFQPMDEYRYHSLAALLAITQKRPAYEILCTKILVTFTNTSDPYIDERTVKDCLFLPYSGVDLEYVDKLADRAVSLGSSHPDALPYFQVAKAMSAYRLGHFPEAVEWAEKALKTPLVYPNSHAYAVLAMAHWQLGHKETARLMLAKGNSLIPNNTSGTTDLGDSWVAWLLARISLNEATALIQPLTATRSGSKSDERIQAIGS